jgi:hypothetical protein
MKSSNPAPAKEGLIDPPLFSLAVAKIYGPIAQRHLFALDRVDENPRSTAMPPCGTPKNRAQRAPWGPRLVSFGSLARASKPIKEINRFL